jgi:hypothetical protein
MFIKLRERLPAKNQDIKGSEITKTYLDPTLVQSIV